jgi:hypothetical protein
LLFDVTTPGTRSDLEYRVVLIVSLILVVFAVFAVGMSERSKRRRLGPFSGRRTRASRVPEQGGTHEH